jgi:hypothetical protein
VRIGREKTAQGQNATNWGPEFVNNSIAACLPKWPARVIESDRATAETPHRWHGNGRLHHGGIEIDNDRHWQALKSGFVGGFRTPGAPQEWYSPYGHSPRVVL